jgi:shikimate dehydrogenase
VIGTPVRHSLSPSIFGAAFDATGLDWTYLAFEVQPGALEAAVGATTALGIRGLSVTMPHKSAIVSLLDHITPGAARLDAVNCVTRLEDGSLEGDNTDGAGLLMALEGAGVAVAGASIVLLGAGGAARAIAAALGDAGAARVDVINRTTSRAEAAAALAGPAGRVGSWADVESADVVINATSVGMDPGGGLPLDVALLSDRHVVVDAVYHPVLTPLLAAAAERGARPVDGVGMLVGQAAVAFERWTGERAPLQAMLAAAGRALAP